MGRLEAPGRSVNYIALMNASKRNGHFVFLANYRRSFHLANKYTCTQYEHLIQWKLTMHRAHLSLKKVANAF